MFFSYIKFCRFSSFLPLYIGQKCFTKKKFMLFCSPFNSTLNLILDTVLNCASRAIVQLEHWRLTSYFTFFKHNTTFISVDFFLVISYFQTRIRYQSIQLNLLYKTVNVVFLYLLIFELKKLKYCAFFRISNMVDFSVFRPYTEVRNVLPKRNLCSFVAHSILLRILY